MRFYNKLFRAFSSKLFFYLKNLASLSFRLVLLVPDTVTAFVVMFVLVARGIPLALKRGTTRAVASRPRLLYVGYTSLDQAQSKGLLRSKSDAERTYNPGCLLKSVTIFVPVGSRNHVTEIGHDITFIEHASGIWKGLPLTRKSMSIYEGCINARKIALDHDVVMIGGPHVASIPGLFVRLTVPVRVVLFIEAFWEEILPMQAYMSKVSKLFWRLWYGILYRTLDGFVGAPSFKPDFYVERGMRRDHIWPYTHPVDGLALEQQSALVNLPKFLQNLTAPLIVFIGRLEKEKLVHDCIAMAAQLKKNGTNFHLIMVGEGTERAALEEKILKKGLQGVVIMTGAQSNAVAFKIAKRAMVCFAPYMGTALVEVLLAGCSVVAYDNTPHRAIVGNGPVSFVASGDINAASEVIRSLLANPVALQAMGLSTQKFAWRKWNKNAIAQAYVAPLLGHSNNIVETKAN